MFCFLSVLKLVLCLELSDVMVFFLCWMVIFCRIFWVFGFRLFYLLRLMIMLRLVEKKYGLMWQLRNLFYFRLIRLIWVQLVVLMMLCCRVLQILLVGRLIIWVLRQLVKKVLQMVLLCSFRFLILRLLLVLNFGVLWVYRLQYMLLLNQLRYLMFIFFWWI